MVVIRQKEAKGTRNRGRKKDLWATGGMEEEEEEGFSNRFVATVCGHCERNQERKMKGIGYLDVSVRMIAGWVSRVGG